MKTSLRSALSLLVLAASTLLFNAGCASKTGGSGSVDWKKFEPMIEVAAYTGAKIYLVEHPEMETLFMSAVDVLDALVADPQINVAKLANALQGLPIKELQDPKAAIIIGSTIVLWNAYKDQIPIGDEGAAVLRPIAVRLRNGLGTAMGLDPIVEPGPEMMARMDLPTNQLMQLKRRP